MYKFLMAIIFSFLTLVGCSEDTTVSKKSELDLFKTKTEALDDYSGIKSVKIIQTVNYEQLLLTEINQDTFYIGELIRVGQQYAAVKLTPTYSLGGASGGSFEFSSYDGQNYTIQFSQEEHSNSQPISDGMYFFSIMDGHTLSNSPSVTTSAIESVQSLD